MKSKSKSRGLVLRVTLATLFLRAVLCGTLLCVAVATAKAQGPTPETGNTHFPGGAYFAYESSFITRHAPNSSAPSATLRPTFEHEGKFNFTWGFRRDFELTVQLPIITRRFHFASQASSPSIGGTGLGDAFAALKYRFLRFDSDRGTTQAAVTFGPKLPTGRTNLRDAPGARLPSGLQPGSGSTDLVFGLNATHTGLFNIHRLVVDGSFLYTLRTEGTQQVKLADTAEARLWLSYRPYQTRTVHQEWWIGPVLTWSHSLRDAHAGVSIPGSAGDTLRLGAVTYFSPRAGLHLWFSAEFPVAVTRNTFYSEERKRFRFGVTRQIHLKR